MGAGQSRPFILSDESIFLAPECKGPYNTAARPIFDVRLILADTKKWQHFKIR
ncbi:hypothetical protein SAMN04488061_2151 [Filomicrobium insigne]|uniref:Uncharacterized protein n=1 Tax=Filomicrobium insigne TaxID=418854 RepID=A0A1H0PUA9_9HYPH|nr:hypothetical protein SAMN04488061_2151 [Filomicrobium insigne]